MIYNNITELVGKTPMIKLNKYCETQGIEGDIFAKLEFFNPAGSVKDRIALSMIEDAEKKGLLKKGSVIIEPTSGNTGIGLAAIGFSKGYRVILTMPNTMSVERSQFLKAYGAEVVLTDGAEGMNGSIAKAKQLAAKIDNSFIPSQFENPANPKAHYLNTGPEIFEDMDGKLDFLVVGIGTGGTISGAGKYLKEKNPSIKIIAVEPEDSPILSEGKSGPHKIQGIGAGFIPSVLNTKIYDEIIKVSNEDAFDTGRKFPHIEGLLIGISSGAALKAALTIAKRPENKGKRIVVVFPDGGDRYFSSAMYQ